MHGCCPIRRTGLLPENPWAELGRIRLIDARRLVFRNGLEAKGEQSPEFQQGEANEEPSEIWMAHREGHGSQSGEQQGPEQEEFPFFVEAELGPTLTPFRKPLPQHNAEK